MSKFSRNIRPFVQSELALANACLRSDKKKAFKHLENAHVLGQEATVLHTLAHWKMLCWGLVHRDFVEVRGQIMRIIGAISKTSLKLLPQGNTGGSNISPFKVMSLSPEHAKIIAHAKG